MIQWLLDKTAKIAQYGQGIGAASRRADRAVVQYVKQRIAGPLIIFDVGANRGDYTKLALAGTRTTVHAFEPSKTAFAELSRRFAGRKDVILNNVALGRKAGEQELHFDAPGSELSSLYLRQLGHHGIQMSSSELVRIDTLDNYCETQNIQHIDLLKLDVEGYEMEVLHGAAQMFERHQIATVSFEFGGCNVDARTFLRDFFQFFGTRKMQISRVTAFGGLHPILRYHEGLEQFRTTTFVAISRS